MTSGLALFDISKLTCIMQTLNNKVCLDTIAAKDYLIVEEKCPTSKPAKEIIDFLVKLKLNVKGEIIATLVKGS